jgi:transposase
MDQKYLFEPIPCDKFDILTKEELIVLLKGEEKLRIAFQKENEELKRQRDYLQQKTFLIENQFVTIKNKIFGKSSEKSPKTGTENISRETETQTQAQKIPKTKVQLPSLRYPNAPLIERDIEMVELPSCNCCGHQMEDSGMTEDSEYLTVIPRQFFVVRQKRHKYRCGKCHGDIKTAPGLPRVTPGGAYSDEMIIDVAMSKFCDLIPMERYCSMAARSGVKGLPPHSLIQTTHALADFVRGAYDKLKDEITSAKVLHADETPHRMLEGDEKSNWYLWGFSTDTACYFETHNTRSGDVASSILKESQCEYLVSDVFSGYNKSVSDTNKFRNENSSPLPPIKNCYCNSHARRKFKEAEMNLSKDANFYIEAYKEIYRLEAESKERPFEEKMTFRREMEKYFDSMKKKANSGEDFFPNKSSMGKAINYFLKNYEGLTLFLQNPHLPIDNNQQEALLRNPVIGRKTWYGTHSKRGALTASIFHSLVESCKLNKVNPRNYFKDLIEHIQQGKPPFTPSEYKKGDWKGVPGS